MNNLGDIPIKLLNQRHVFLHVIGNPGLVILVHLLNQEPITVQHRLHLMEALVEHGPGFGVAVLSILDFAIGLAGGGADGCRCGGRLVWFLASGTAVVGGGIFHGGFGGGGGGVIQCAHVHQRREIARLRG